MTFGTFLIVVQLVPGALLGLLAAGVAVWPNNEMLAAILTACSTALILFGLITATSIRALSKTGADHGH
jgi:hypothetical protein